MKEYRERQRARLSLNNLQLHERIDRLEMNKVVHVDQTGNRQQPFNLDPVRSRMPQPVRDESPSWRHEIDVSLDKK